MNDLKQLRADPQRFIQGARDKGVYVDINRILELDERLRALQTAGQTESAFKNALSKEIGRCYAESARARREEEPEGDAEHWESVASSLRA